MTAVGKYGRILCVTSSSESSVEKEFFVKGQKVTIGHPTVCSGPNYCFSICPLKVSFHNLIVAAITVNHLIHIMPLKLYHRLELIS